METRLPEKLISDLRSVEKVRLAKQLGSRRGRGLVGSSPAEWGKAVGPPWFPATGSPISSLVTPPGYIFSHLQLKLAIYELIGIAKWISARDLMKLDTGRPNSLPQGRPATPEPSTPF